MKHSFDFDPTYGLTLEELLTIQPPKATAEFATFWKLRFHRVQQIAPRPSITDTGKQRGHWIIYDISYHSSHGATIKGWLLIPKTGIIRRGFVVGHGYGGRDEPDFDLPFHDAAILFPCCRGISRSTQAPYSSDPQWHVLHDIDKPNHYILGGCVDDIWLAFSSLLRLFPQTKGHLGYLGISFGGGIGAMAVAWDSRVKKAHFNIPSFGHQKLRLTLPTHGSGNSVQTFFKKNRKAVLETLRFHDAALAAQWIRIPTHFALAKFDPVVAPPGQFAIYNAIPGEKQLFVLDAGHHDYPLKDLQHRQLQSTLVDFFADL